MQPKRLAVRLANHGLAKIARLQRRRGDASTIAGPIFVIGVPRSGSTLLYQALVRYFDVGYFANIHHRFFLAPSIVERWTRATRHSRKESYESTFGNTDGWNAPSENWQFWYRFFRRSPQYVPLDEADPAKLRELRAEMNSFAEACGRPVVVKNLPCALRLKPIIEALPDSLFLLVRRDPVSNCESLLTARQTNCGSYTKWWSVEPPELARMLELPPHEQVVEQYRSIHHIIEADRQSSDPSRFLDIEYEAFCQDTLASLDKIDAFLRSHGVTLGRRDDIPTSFDRSPSQSLDQNLRKQVREYYHRSGL